MLSAHAIYLLEQGVVKISRTSLEGREYIMHLVQPGGTFNDVGIITLPDDLGHVALTVLTKDFDNADSSDVDSIIAEVARFVYDYFTFTLET